MYPSRFLKVIFICKDNSFKTAKIYRLMYRGYYNQKKLLFFFANIFCKLNPFNFYVLNFEKKLCKITL